MTSVDDEPVQKTDRSLSVWDLRCDGVVREWAKFLLLGIQTPAAEEDAQAGHDRDREIHAQDAGDLAPCHHSENCAQGMQFHALAHNSGRRDIVLKDAPDEKKDDQD